MPSRWIAARMWIFGAVLWATPLSLVHAQSWPFTWGGRLTDPDGRPVAGPVDLEIDFFTAASGGVSLLGGTPLSFPASTLQDGIFAINIGLTPAQMHQIFPSAEIPVWIQLTDKTSGRTWPRQRFGLVPYALKIPVDGTSLAYDVNGRLRLNVTGTGSPGQVLKLDPGGEMVWGTATGSGTGDMLRSTYDTNNNGVVDSATVAGNVTGVVAVANGGTGAATPGDARTNLGLGTAATQNTGTAANNVVQLDGTGALPAVSGASLTNLNASNVSSGTLAVTRGGTGATSSSDARTNLGLGTAAVLNAGTAANNLVQLNASAELPAVSGANLTNINAASVATGVIPVNRGGTNASTLGDARTNLGLGTAAVLDAGTGANNVVQLNGSSQLPAVSGANLTNLPSPTTVGTLTSDVNFDGTSSRTVAVGRSPTNAGNALTISAGGAQSGTTDQNGGTLVIAGGTSTGTGDSEIEFRTAAPGSTGAADNAATTKMVILGSGNVGIGTATPTQALEVSNTIKAAKMNAGLPDALAFGGGDFNLAAKNGLQVLQGAPTDEIRIRMVNSDNTVQLGFWNYDPPTDSVSFGAKNGSPLRLHVGVERMRIDTSGNLGIGTTTLGSRLHVVGGTDSTPVLIAQGVAGQTGNLAEFRNNSGTILSRVMSDGSLSLKDGDTNYATLRAHSSMSSDVTWTLPAAPSAGQYLTTDASGNLSWDSPATGVTGLTSSVTFNGDSARAVSMDRHTTADTAGNTMTVSAGGATTGATDKSGGTLILSGGTSTGSASSSIEFQTAAGGTSGTADRTPATRMTILGNGNVGINTASPASRLQVDDGNGRLSFSASGNEPTLTVGRTASSGWSNLYLENSNAGLRLNGNGELRSWAAASYYPTFYASGSEAMRISTDGNMGIGTTSPGTRLHVRGSASGHSPTSVDGLFVENNGAQNSFIVFQTATNGGGKSFTVTNAGNVGVGSTLPDAKFHVQNTVAGSPVLISQGAAAQTGNLAEFRSSSGTVLSRVMSDGSLSLKDGDTNYASIRAHAAMPADLTWTLPASANSGEFLTTDASGNLSWGNPTSSVTGLTSSVTFNGNAARAVSMDRHSTADTAGNAMTVSAGGATSGATNQAGGNLVLASGTATGNASSAIEFQTATAGGSGTADRAPTTKMTILGNGNVGIATASPVTRISNTASAISDAAGSTVTPSGLSWLSSSGSGYVAAFENSSSVAGRNGILVKTSQADTSTYIMKMESGGVNRMAIRSDGNVGIGTTSPGAQLHLNASSASTVGLISRGAASQTANLAEFQNSSGTILSRVQSDGSISLKDGDTDYATIRAHASMPASMTFTLPSGAASAGQFLTSDMSGNLSWSAPTASVTGLTSNVTFNGDAARAVSMDRHTTADTAGQGLTISAGGATSGATDKNGGSVVIASGTATGSGSSTIQFQTAAGGTAGTADRAPATRMTILGNGSVGIGTTNPERSLDVAGTFRATGDWTGPNGFAINGGFGPHTSATWIDMPTSGPSGIGHGGPGQNAWIAYASGANFYFTGTDTGDIAYRNASNKKIHIGIDNGIGTASPTMTFAGTNVGIGTTTPSAKFDVLGVDGTDTVNTVNVGVGRFYHTTNNFDTTAPLPVLTLHRTGKNLNSWGNTANFELSRYANTNTDAFTQLDINLNQGNTNTTNQTIMSLRDNGNVGIGTRFPAVGLHIRQYADVPMRIESMGTHSAGFDLWDDGNRVGTFGVAGTPGAFVAGSAVNDFVFRSDAGGKFLFSNSSASASSVAILDSGNVGIGNTNPAARLDVTGQIRSRTNNDTDTTIDWSLGNTQTTSASCGAVTFTNMLDGGHYTLIIQGATQATCTFSQDMTGTADDLASTDFRFSPANGDTDPSTHTVYRFVRAGNRVYVTWIKGFAP
jgi:hypothetical protein